MILRAAFLWLILPNAALAQNAPMHEVAASLRPGQYRWAPDASRAVPEVVVSLALQRAYVYRGDTLVGVASVSTGKRGKATPVGDYAILQKARWHRSNLYSNAPMPFMQRLTWDGIALHAGRNPGYPASHGCIRLPPEFARVLFDVVPMGARVTVADYPPELPVYLEVEDIGLGVGEPRLDYDPAIFL